VLAPRVSPGGVTAHTLTLAQALMQHGWDVCLATNWRHPGNGISRDEVRRMGIRAAHIPFPDANVRKALAPVRAVQSAAMLRRLIKLYRPQIVHAHWRVVLPYALAAGKVPTIFTLHTLGLVDPVTRALFRIPNAIIAISEAARHELTTLGVPSSRIRYIPSGVSSSLRPADRDEKASLRSSLGLPHDCFVIASVGRLESVKRHDVTVSALAKLAERGVDAHLVLVGEGSQRKSLSDQVRSLRLSNRVTIAGHQEPWDFLRAADVFVLSSEREGFPLAVVEAMMVGLPVVRTPSGGAEDQVVPGQTGYLFPHNDSAALAEVLIGLSDDPDGRAAMGNEAARRARSLFTRETMTKRVINLYLDALATQPRPPH
jgi:glycosyltransferase involved in cell wall biosynthesis